MTDTCVGHHPNEPAAPDIGRLCLDCYSRLRSKLLELPAVANWLHAHQAAGGQADEKVSGSREDPIPLRLDILDLIGPDSRKPPPPIPAATVLLWEDGVTIGYYATWPEATRARWAEILDSPDTDVDVHRWQVRVTERGGVDQRGEESLRAAVMYWARRVHGEGRHPWTDRNDLVGLAAWVAGHLSWVAEQDWVAEMYAEVTRLAGTAHKLVPWREEIRRDTAPCARCSRTTVVLHIGVGVRRCERHAGGCGREEPLSEYVLQALLPATRQAG